MNKPEWKLCYVEYDNDWRCYVTTDWHGLKKSVYDKNLSRWQLDVLEYCQKNKLPVLSVIQHSYTSYGTSLNGKQKLILRPVGLSFNSAIKMTVKAIKEKGSEKKVSDKEESTTKGPQKPYIFQQLDALIESKKEV